MSDDAVPIRVQLSRRKGYRLPDGAVKVDRTTKFGNPFVIGKPNPYGTITANARHSWQIFLGFAPGNEKLVAAARAELQGKNLACWCKLCSRHADGKPLGVECEVCAPCHADVLLKIANEESKP